MSANETTEILEEQKCGYPGSKIRISFIYIRLFADPIVLVLCILALIYYSRLRKYFPISEQWPRNVFFTTTCVLLWLVEDVIYNIYSYSNHKGNGLLECTWGSFAFALLDLGWCIFSLGVGVGMMSRALWVCQNHYRTNFALDPANQFNIGENDDPQYRTVAEIVHGVSEDNRIGGDEEASSKLQMQPTRTGESRDAMFDWDCGPVAGGKAHAIVEVTAKRRSWNPFQWDMRETADFLLMAATKGCTLFATLLIIAATGMYIPPLVWPYTKYYDKAYNMSTIMGLIVLSILTPVVLSLSVVLIARVSTFADTTSITLQMKILAVYWWLWLIPSICDLTIIQFEPLAAFVDLLPLATCTTTFAILVWWPLTSAIKERTRRARISTSANEDDLMEHLENKDKREAMRTFMAGEFASENLQFWEAVEGYRRRLQSTPPPAPGTYTSNNLTELAQQVGPMVGLANRLYSTYVAERGRFQVNLPAPKAQQILHELRHHKSMLQSLYIAAAAAAAAQENDPIFARKISFPSNTSINQVAPAKRSRKSAESVSLVGSWQGDRMNQSEPSKASDGGETQSSVVLNQPIKTSDSLINNVENTSVLLEWALGAWESLPVLFDQAQHHIVHLMATDVFPRYMAKRPRSSSTM